LLFVAGAGLLLWQVAAIEFGSQAEPFPLAGGSLDGAVPIELNVLKGTFAVTDAGAQIPLYEARSKVSDPSFEVSPEALRSHGAEGHVMQTAPGGLAYNCHGWVFTGGRHWVRSAFVERILQDNRYDLITAPVAGDLAIFRDEAGQITHTALVRGVGEDGLILLESKWGSAGRYVHTHAHHLQRNNSLNYYRTNRGTHLLRGLPGTGPRRAPAGDKTVLRGT
jgi:hypothetical protein